VANVNSLLRMKKTKILIGLIFTITCMSEYQAQNDSTYFQIPNKDKDKKEKIKDDAWKEKITFGGNFAFYSSVQSSYIDISPLIGYKVAKPVLIAAGPVYNYYSTKLYGSRFTVDVYGFRALARLYVLQSFFIQTGYDYLNRKILLVQNGVLQSDRVWFQNVWIGGGIRYAVFSNTYMFTSVLYNLTPSPYSIYSNPMIQVGFISGF